MELSGKWAVASINYPSDINEFEKAGLTPVPSEVVKPFRVKESPAQMECKVKQIIPLGEDGGAGHLILCEIVRMHISEEVLDEKGRINPHKMDLMGRLGRAFYVRASGESIHRIYQPFNQLGIGFDGLPTSIRNSEVLTGNNLGILAGLAQPPSAEEINDISTDERVVNALKEEKPIKALHLLVQKELAKDNRTIAASMAWLGEAISS